MRVTNLWRSLGTVRQDSWVGLTAHSHQRDIPTAVLCLALAQPVAWALSEIICLSKLARN